jgi:hypothetical protein
MSPGPCEVGRGGPRASARRATPERRLRRRADPRRRPALRAALSAGAAFAALLALTGPGAAGIACAGGPPKAAGSRTPSYPRHVGRAESPNLLAWWTFDDEGHAGPPGGAEAGRDLRAGLLKTRDAVSGLADPITGNFRFVRGVSGAGLKLDGYTTSVLRTGSKAPRLDGAFSLEAWIALAAYPWNRCPIAAQTRGDAGFAFCVGPRGELEFRASDEGEWLDCVTGPVLPLKTWAHVAAVYDPGTGIRVFADGRLVGSLASPSRFKPAAGADIVLGSVTEPVRPSHAVGGGEGTLPSWFSLDAILDEVKLFAGALNEQDVLAAAAAPPASREPPPLPLRRMPSGGDRPGPFGAVCANLEYCWEWDDLWRVGDHPDVVVRFDRSPVRVVFWRGLRYSPAWVTENGTWVADQSAESGNAEGCIEHMQDIRCQYSHVRILESTPARAVVHWRYAPVSSRDHRWPADSRTGWDWWVDETYTFFPDGTAVRKIAWLEPGPGPGSRLPWLQLQETSILCHPGQNAKDVLERQAFTLLNLAGERHTYGWPDSGEASTRERRNRDVDPSLVRRIEPAGACIQVVHSRAAYQSFVAFEPPGNEFVVYVGRVRDDLVNFPAYNHWPVNQTASDGRFAQAADRASSFSIAQGYPVIHEAGRGLRWTALLYGMRNMAPPAGPEGGYDAVLAAARSWARPPAMRAMGGGFEAGGYDASQRAYMWRRTDAGATVLRAEIDASEPSPVENLSLIVEGWDDDNARVLLDGHPAEGARLGLVRGLEGDRLVIWIKVHATRPVVLELRGGAGERRPSSSR